jgi:hypothetical protein
MSRQVVTRLEALSGYQFHFNLSDPRAAENPVNWAHTQVRIGAETLSVLSRTAFCGADYSGRTNKIAHHFLLEHGEQSPNGPAWMLMEMASRVFVAGYGGEPRNLPKRDLRTLLPADARPPEPATTWESVTGDAGWAGMLVKAFRENPKVPAFVIFAPGQELLPLFEESLALLPPEERWQVGFATYYTALPAGCQYHWRGIIAGSSVAKEIQRFPNATVIDLTTALGQAPDSMFTEAARAGTILPPVRVPERPKIQIVERAPEPVPVAGEVAAEADAFALGLDTEQGAPAIDPRGVATSPVQLRALMRRARRARWVTPLVAAVTILAMSTLVSTALHFYNPWRSTPQAEMAPAVATTAPPTQAAASTDDRPATSPAVPATEAGAAKPAKPATPGVTATTPASSPEQGGKAVDTQLQTAQTNKSESKREDAKPPKDQAGAESGARPPTESNARGQPLPKSASDVRIDSVGRNPVLLEKKYEPQWLDPPKTDKQGNLRWKVAAASSFVEMPAGLDPTRAVCETAGRIEISMPSELSGVRVPIITCFLETASGEHELICTVSRAAQTFAAEFRNLVVELADHQNRRVLRCPFEKVTPVTGSVPLGYGPNGKAISEGTYNLPYPWVSVLRVSEPPLQDMIVTLKPDAANKRVVVSVHMNNLPSMVEIMRPNWEARARAQKDYDEASRKHKFEQEAVKRGDATVKGMLERDKKEKKAKEIAQDIVDQRRRGLVAFKDEEDRCADKLQQSKSAAEGAATQASAKMEEIGKTITSAGVVKVSDPWDRVVAEVQVKFASCKPENVTGP